MAGSVNPEQTMCNDCRHQDRESFAVPTCAHPKAYRPNGCQQACVVVLRRVPEPCPYHEER